MNTQEKTTITVSALIKSPIQKVWEVWTEPAHIVNWNFAADAWQCPKATNDLKAGGEFSWRMEAKDGSMGFDFNGTFERVELNKEIIARLDDGRRWVIEFEDKGKEVLVSENFEIEDENTLEQQRGGWQAILDNFKKYTEGLK